ncbi:MAG TPA: pseudouridine synthase [Hydrogenophaga sp.]|uniref:pseudouridine synthase n=1 Tax=Hydrogenophaga sp. TaxID=1904254 RepID=UPI002CB165D2|nr:pseudouridine synthase [Hydrogenophaga sp.]HSX93795.1 pseudouridine synthase [Hydrogenophaga sp.]
MASDPDKRTLSLKPAAPKPPTDPRAPRRPPVRPRGPARARPLSSAERPELPVQPAATARAPQAPAAAPEALRPPRPTGPRAPSPRPASSSAPSQRPPSQRPPSQRPPSQRPPSQRSQAPRPPAQRPPAQRPPAPPAADEASAPREGTRLNKRLAELGLCSRREADEWIARGWVLVDGQVAHMGQPVLPDAQIKVLPQATSAQDERATFLLHKPVGYVSGQPEDGHEAAVVLLQPGKRWKEDRSPRRFSPAQFKGLAPAGRLDIDSTGLLVLTQDGRVARALIGEDSGVEKEYLVRVVWAPNGPQGPGVVEQDVQAVVPADCLAQLRHGLSLDGEPLKPAQVEWLNPEQLRFVLTEGKKRQIRRMCEAVGLHVVGLKRVRIGGVRLGHLPQGQWRYLLPDEVF